jgi:hypothetical protein
VPVARAAGDRDPVLVEDVGDRLDDCGMVVGDQAGGDLAVAHRLWSASVGALLRLCASGQRALGHSVSGIIET